MKGSESSFSPFESCRLLSRVLDLEIDEAALSVDEEDKIAKAKSDEFAVCKHGELRDEQTQRAKGELRDEQTSVPSNYGRLRERRKRFDTFTKNKLYNRAARGADVYIPVSRKHYVSNQVVIKHSKEVVYFDKANG
ncbi:hypothetical protein Rs2_07205 [Raphanus sativus]|nr:hypothetical protein Rs2_07205 [Raphanus sativus]